MFFTNSKGRNVIRVADTTDHGGEVITGADNWLVDGKPVARIGDLVRCPKCLNQTYPIVEGDETIITEGRRIAFDGHLTACGARLISSLGGAAPYAASFSGSAIGSSLNTSPATGTRALSNHAKTNIGQGYSLAEETPPSVLLKIDERAIIARYREAVRYMVDNDMRYKGHGWANARWNNLNSEDFLGQYRRCYPQSQLVADWLNDLDLHYEWTFYIAGDSSGIVSAVTGAEHHYWVEAVAPIGSTVIKLDALYDEVAILDSPSNMRSRNITLRVTSKSYTESGIKTPGRFISSQKLWRYSVDD